MTGCHESLRKRFALQNEKTAAARPTPCLNGSDQSQEPAIMQGFSSPAIDWSQARIGPLFVPDAYALCATEKFAYARAYRGCGAGHF